MSGQNPRQITPRRSGSLGRAVEWFGRNLLAPLAVAVIGGLLLLLLTTAPPIDVRITRLDASGVAPQPDYEGECLVIQNFGSTAVNLANWTLEDAGGHHRFTFPAFTLNPGKSVEVWTKPGSNTETALYWGKTTSIWNNQGDTAYLRDQNGTLIAEKGY